MKLIMLFPIFMILLSKVNTKANKVEVLFAGFGGQGMLFSGKVLAYGGVIESRQVSWIPSYGPEMRGGTANCGVILSDQPIGSILVDNPHILMTMNRPSIDKFESAVLEGGQIYLDSSLIDRKVERTDVEAFYIPATKMANDMGMPKLANMILLGAVVKGSKAIKEETVFESLRHVIPEKKAKMLTSNIKAVEAGMKYMEEHYK